MTTKKNIRDLIADRKESIAQKWTALVLSTYESAFIATHNKNQFGNPVGYNLTGALKNLLKNLLGDAPTSEAAPDLETIIDIRTVQDFTPSQAVSVLFLVKKVVREELAKTESASDQQDLIDKFEEKADALALMAFDRYMENKERLHRIQVRELKSGTHDLQCPSVALRRSQRETAGNKQQLKCIT